MSPNVRKKTTHIYLILCLISTLYDLEKNVTIKYLNVLRVTYSRGKHLGHKHLYYNANVVLVWQCSYHNFNRDNIYCTYKMRYQTHFVVITKSFSFNFHRLYILK